VRVHIFSTEVVFFGKFWHLSGCLRYSRRLCISEEVNLVGMNEHNAVRPFVEDYKALLLGFRRGTTSGWPFTMRIIFSGAHRQLSQNNELNPRARAITMHLAKLSILCFVSVLRKVSAIVATALRGYALGAGQMGGAGPAGAFFSVSTTVRVVYPASNTSSRG